jgi:hypothetical protein
MQRSPVVLGRMILVSKIFQPSQSSMLPVIAFSIFSLVHLPGTWKLSIPRSQTLRRVEGLDSRIVR